MTQHDLLIGTQHGYQVYLASYLLSITLAAAMALWWGRKHGYPMLPWLLVIMTGGLFFILGEKFGSYSATEWTTAFTSFHLPRTGKKTILGGILGLLAGCCFGTPTSLPWGIHYGPASLAYHAQMLHGQVHLYAKTTAAIHPVQIYEMLGCILIALLVFLTRNRWKSRGSLFLFSVLCYSFLRFLVEFFRDPESGFVMVSLHFGLKTIQWVILAAMAAWVILIYAREIRFTGARAKAPSSAVPGTKPVWLIVLFLGVAFAGRNWIDPDEYYLMILFLAPAVFITVRSLYRPLNCILLFSAKICETLFSF
jgi:phosphatidylglycerol:prolipoprotein diacylglycerol transferase